MIAERLAAQLLSGPPAGSVREVVDRLLAVQAQDLRGARLSVRSRSTGLASSDLDRALADREVVVDWLQRGTLHLVLAEDHGWQHALLAPGLFAGNARRLAQEGVPPADADRAVTAVARALERHGPLPRARLREAVDRAGVRTKGQALVHVLMLASLRGLLVRGPVVGTEQAWVLAPDWLGRSPALDRTDALVRLAARYLAGHAPASDRDLARWSGLPLRDVRAGLAGLGAAVLARPDGLLALAGRHLDAPLPPPRLLGPFDPLLLGWVSRADVIGEHRNLVTDNGLFRPFALVGGRAVATWRWTDGQAVVLPLEPVSEVDLAALGADALDVARYLTT